MTKTISYLIGSIMGAVLVIGLCAPGLAQQTDRSASGKTSKSATAKRTAASQSSVTRQQQSQSWSIEDALPDRHSIASQYSNLPTVSEPKLGRIPLQRGSIGFETETKVKSNSFADGRQVPGLETVKRQDPSYFGLSLSVQTHDKALPLPLASPWRKPE